MMSCERLEVYQLAMQFLALALQIIKQLPAGYSDLADQLKRAAMSLPQNIGERDSVLDQWHGAPPVGR